MNSYATMSDISFLNSESVDSAELRFSRGVVTYIVCQEYPRIPPPYRLELTETLTFEVCAKMHDTCIDLREIYPNAFEELFTGYEKTCGNFCLLCERLGDTFLVFGYSHMRFIKFCCEISDHAISMYKEGCPDAFEIAIFTIFRVLWRLKEYWENTDEIATLSNQWNYLDLFCKLSGDENKENEPWHANRGQIF